MTKATITLDLNVSFVSYLGDCPYSKEALDLVASAFKEEIEKFFQGSLNEISATSDSMIIEINRKDLSVRFESTGSPS